MHEQNGKWAVAVLDDYQGVALELADWSPVLARASVDVFSDHLDDPDAVVERLTPYEVVCVMRERTPLPRDMIERLPRLNFIASTGPRNASIDIAAAKERGIAVVHTSYTSSPTIELTWALILGGARHLLTEAASLRAGGWQRCVGDDMAGKTLGIIGLGNVGAQVARSAWRSACRSLRGVKTSPRRPQPRPARGGFERGTAAAVRCDFHSLGA